MPVTVSMLRGVNLGASRRMKMDDLRAVYESLGLSDVRTYVQSGNVVFRAARAISAERIEAAIGKRFGFHSDVILRTPAELKDAVARNPFPGVEGSKLLVWFLAEDVGEDTRAKVRALDTPPEKLHIEGRELYIYYPNGMARPKLNMTAVGKALGVSGTGRNWNTVTKLLEMAEEL
jgi:uncharacterized protein (DUF1697 family)